MSLDLFNLPVPNIGRIAADGLVHAGDLLGFLFVRFFTPEAIALEIVIRRERRHDFLRWFRIVEEMLLRVLFLEASAIASRTNPQHLRDRERAGKSRPFACRLARLQSRHENRSPAPSPLHAKSDANPDAWEALLTSR